MSTDLLSYEEHNASFVWCRPSKPGSQAVLKINKHIRYAKFPNKRKRMNVIPLSPTGNPLTVNKSDDQPVERSASLFERTERAAARRSNDTWETWSQLKLFLGDIDDGRERDGVMLKGIPEARLPITSLHHLLLDETCAMKDSSMPNVQSSGGNME